MEMKKMVIKLDVDGGDGYEIRGEWMQIVCNLCPRAAL